MRTTPRLIENGDDLLRAIDLPMDHRMFVPGHTLWCGEHEGLETQVRSILRQVEGVAR